MLANSLTILFKTKKTIDGVFFYFISNQIKSNNIKAETNKIIGYLLY